MDDRLTDTFDGDGLRLAQRLAGAIRYQTVSHEDPTQTDYRPFRELLAYLEETFPRVHAGLERQLIGQVSQLFRWPGCRPELRPALLMGHVDVVPAPPETGKGWIYPPFDGRIEEGYIWGRGTLDDKCAVTGPLEAVEGLLQSGFQPERTLYLAFGEDEEVGGSNGAAQIAALLRSQGIALEYVLDEGLAVTEGIVPSVAKPVALVGIAEKGYVTLELVVESKGGHSSAPPHQTAVGILAAAIARLEKNPLPARLDSIIFRTLDHLAPELPAGLRAALKNRRVTGRLLVRLMARSEVTNASVRTTTAATMFDAGVQENVLATRARAVVNFRIMPGDSVSAVKGHVARIVGDPRVLVAVVSGITTEPSPVSSTQSPAYRWIVETIHTVFPDALTGPGLVLGATDCRHFAALSPHCYRFSPLWIRGDDLARMHGVDERISVKNYAQAVQFYAELIRRSCGAGPGVT